MAATVSDPNERQIKNLSTAPMYSPLPTVLARSRAQRRPRFESTFMHHIAITANEVRLESARPAPVAIHSTLTYRLGPAVDRSV